MTTDFCEYCNAPLEDAEKLVTVYRHRKWRHFIFETVPAQVCARCGERYFSAIVVREMERLMNKRNQAGTTTLVPVIEMTLAG